MELEILDNGELVELINFDRVEVGSKNIKIIQIHNKSLRWPIENITLKKTDDADYTIEYPKRLNPNETANITIRWNPKFERRTPLNISHLFIGDLKIG